MARYAQAAAIVPEPCRVFGTRLRPFCLGHHLLFKRLGLPFAGNADVDAGRGDILAAIAICGEDSYENTLELFHSGEWPEYVRRWTRKVERGLFWKNDIARQLFFEDGEVLFRAYLQDGYQRPPVWRYESKGTIALTAPWELTLKNRLVMAGYSESEVLNGYLPGRWYDYYSVFELKAAASITDEKQWRRIFFTKEDAMEMNPEDFPNEPER